MPTLSPVLYVTLCDISSAVTKPLCHHRQGTKAGPGTGPCPLGSGSGSQTLQSLVVLLHHNLVTEIGIILLSLQKLVHAINIKRFLSLQKVKIS